MEISRYTIVPIWKRLKLFFARFFCGSAQPLRSSRTNMWRIRKLSPKNGATRCEEDNRVPHSCHAWSKTDVPLDCADLARKDLLLQQYGEPIEKLSQQDKWSKFCMDAGFLNVVEIGQYSMTKDTAEFSQFKDAVACREYTLPRDEQ